MDERSLVEGRQIAERLRFSGDSISSCHRPFIGHGGTLRDYMAATQLLISRHVTPTLAPVLDEVCDRFSIPRETVDAFVYAEPRVVAECLPAGPGRCVVRFSSGLVDLLDAQEFAFVLGHELGHFLLQHNLTLRSAPVDSIEVLMIKRSQEISADRCGLLVSESLDVATRALMKSISGLSGRHLRFDIRRFLDQLDSVGPGALKEFMRSTHPSILVRCRALLWLSMNDVERIAGGLSRPELLGSIDARVERDLKRYVDGWADEQIADAKQELLLWATAFEVVQFGAFRKDAQRAVAEALGEHARTKLMELLSSMPAEGVDDAVYRRMKAARDRLEALVPLSFRSEVEEIQAAVARVLADLD